MGRWALRAAVALLVLASVVLGWLWRYAVADPAGELFAQRGPLLSARIEASGSSTRGDDRFERSWVRLTGGHGLTVECGVLAPRDRSTRHPAIVLLGGWAAGRRAIEYAKDVPDAVILALDYRVDWSGTRDVAGVLRDVPAVRRQLLEVVPAAGLAADYLLGRPDVHAARLVLVGFSFGALFVPCLAAHDRRYAAAAMVDGGGDVGAIVAANLRPWEGETTSRAAGWAAGLLLRPLEPLRYADRISPTPLLMINGSRDARVPRASVEKLFAAAREPKRLLWLDAGHVDPGDPALTQRIITSLAAELRLAGVL
jgi:dienelactone hydrolase